MMYKRIISCVLAFSMVFSIMPVSAVDGANEFENIVMDSTSVIEGNLSTESITTETTVSEINSTDYGIIPFSVDNSAIQLNKISETDSSITISWNGITNDNLSYYEIICNGTIVESGITDTTYTIMDLISGNEYEVSVCAYDTDGNVIGTSDIEYFYTDWNITSGYTLSSNKIVSDLYLNGGTFDLSGYTLTVKGNVYLSSGYLKINNGKLYVDGNFNMFSQSGSYGTGYLTMTNANDYICVNGDFTVYTYYAGSSLTDGTIEVKGNFTQKQYSSANNFNPNGNHKVILSGEGLQTVSFAKTESCFNILEILNFSAEGIVFTTPVTINKLIDNGCNVTFANGERSGWTLEGDETIEGDINLSTGTLDLNGHKLTITGNLIHSGGTVLVNGGELEVQGNYYVQAFNGTNYINGAGILNMTNEADTVKVHGSFIMQSTQSHDGKLTAGILEVGGDLKRISGSNTNFYTSGTHMVVLNGSEQQTVSIANSGKNYSRINNLKILNTSDDGVNFATATYVAGTLYNTESKVTNGVNLILSDAGTLADDIWNHDLTFNENRALNADTEIGGNLYLDGGTFDLSEYTLTVKGNVYLSSGYLKMNKGKLYADGNFNMSSQSGSYGTGYLTMTNAEDYICVNGDFTVYSRYNYSTLTDGTIEVKGNFTQKYYNGYANNFAPSGNHKVILSGEGLQIVSFERTESGFNIIEIKNYSEEGVVFATPVTINELIDNGCNVSFANGERSGWTLESDETIDGDLNLSRGTLDLNGHKLTIKGNLIHSGGTVLVNGGELEVQGDYLVRALNGKEYTNSSGILNMTNEADTVKVHGNFVMQSTQSHNGMLTAGTLEIGGNLTQNGANNYNFYTSGSHTVVLNGSEKQTVSIANNSKSYSRLNNLNILNTSDDGVDFARATYVTGTLYNTESKVTNGVNLILSGNLAENVWNYDLCFDEDRNLSSDIKIVGNLYLNKGTLALDGYTLTVNGDIYLGAGSYTSYLNINKGKLYVDGNFNMIAPNGSYGIGYLRMTSAEDYICVNGDFTVYTYYAYSTLTDGTIEVKGNFTQKHYNSNTNDFAPSGNHKVILSGEGLQTVSFTRTESGFNILEIQNYSKEGVVFITPVTINEFIDNGCNVTFENGERSGWTLESDETIEGDINLAIGTLDLNGHKLTITGNLIHSGGTVFVNGGELEVQGDYLVQALNGNEYTNSAGILNMTNEADTVKVLGNFVMQSTQSHDGKLTAGTLEIGGDFTQNIAYSYNFHTSGSHTLVLNGSEKQTVSIANNSKNYSRINNLKILNTSNEGVIFATDTYVTGNLYNTETRITNGINLILTGTLADNAWNWDIWINENRVLNADTEIGGNLYISGGTLDLNENTLTVNGDVYLGAGSYTSYLNINKGELYVDGNFNMTSQNGGYGIGYLTMKNTEDYICVNGDFTVYTYYASSTLTNGTIELKGNFTQKHYNNNTNDFAPSGNHKVILSGEGLQTVSFTSTESGFNILEIKNYSEEGVVFATSVTIVELIDNGCNVTFANGGRSGWTLKSDETIEGDLNLSTGTLDLNGHKLTVTGNLIHSGGTVLVNGGELEVQGDYLVQALNGTSYTNSAGVLNMTNEADTVKVHGSFVMQSTQSHDGKLTAGTLEIGGDFTQNITYSYNFHTLGAHTVVLNGSEKQTVSIAANNGKNYSRINNLKITNTSDDGVNFATATYVVGTLYNTESKVTNGVNLILSGTLDENVWNHDLTLNENRVLNADTEIGENLYLDGGTLNLNRYTLTVKGDMNLSAGYLSMTNSEDYICVNGNFTVYTPYSNSILTDGIIEVKGNFTQKYSNNNGLSNFAPSGNHKVILSGSKVQNVTFASTSSQFNILEITKPLDTGYIFSRTPLWNELIESNSDQEPPTAPKNLESTRSMPSSIVMTWKASTDNNGVMCYYIYRDGVRVGQTNELQYIDSGLTSHTLYVYYVTACDFDGNESEWSNIIEVLTDVDASAPSKPTNLAAKIQSEGVIRLTWTASSDNGSVVKYNVYRDGMIIGSSNGTAYTDSTATGGYYEYYVEAVDNDGNVSNLSDSVFIDNLAPTTPILKVDTVNDKYIAISWESSDNVGVVRYDLYKNGGIVKSNSSNIYLDSDISIDTTYTYYVVAYDAAGNVSEKSNEMVVYTGEDEEAPVILSVEYVGKPSFKNAVISVSSSDNCGVSKIYLQYSVDKINWIDYASENASGKISASVKFGVDTSEMPDGKVYIRAYAEDLNGNISNMEDSPICEITVDNTAPEKVTGVTADTSGSRIEIKWNAPESDDVAYFRIYRKSGSEDFVLIKDNYMYLNYFDNDIELGIEYTYYVTAVDEHGNESIISDTVTGGMSDDTVAPEILSVYPKNGAVLDTNQAVGVSARDNFKLDKIIVEIRPIGGEWQTVFTEENINSYGKSIQFELDTADFTTGNYELRTYAYDLAGNISKYVTNSYSFKECELSAPVLSAIGEGWRNELSWTMENADDLLGFYVYRKTLVSAEYSLIASITNSEYTDNNLTPGKTYYYMVEAVDARNNHVKSNEVSSVPTDNDDVVPLADAGSNVMGIIGETINFNGSNSWDNHYVATYEWNFGDGTTAEGVRVSHSYEKEGTYDVTLTVTDSAGNSDSHTIKAYIYINDYGTVLIKTVLDGSGAAIGNVKIYCEIPGVESTDYSTDISGTFKFVAPKGSYGMYFFKDGYMPKYEQITVTGENITQKIQLEQKDLVGGSLTSRELDIDEIIERGIDINDPDNQFVYEFTVEYKESGNSGSGKKRGKFTFTVNSEGEIIGNVNTDFPDDRNNVFTSVKSIIGNGGRSYRDGNSNGSSSDSIPVSVAVFSVTTQLSWFKEFYDVELMVINNASNDFYIQNSQAVLNLPNSGGLSLADTSREESLIQIMGDNGVIGGQDTRYASWTVRGDKAGKYDLSADFTGVLMPFGEDVKVTFKTDEPLVVEGGNRLKLDIIVTGEPDYWTCTFTLTNISDKTLYNVQVTDFCGFAEFHDVTDMKLVYPDGTVITVPWRDGEPIVDEAKEYLPVFGYDPINSTLTLKREEQIVGYYSITKASE